MRPFMSDYIPHCYALMRIVAGFLFLWHGAQKLFAIPSLCRQESPPSLPMWPVPSSCFAGYWL